MNKLAFFLTTLLCVAPAAASDRLDPEDPAFEIGADWSRHYDTMVLTILKPIFAPEVRARMINVPSFRPEYAVGLAEHGGAWRVVAVEPAIHLWAYEVLDSSQLAAMHAPADWHDVRVTQCEQAVSVPLAERLLNLWKTMLENSGYPRTPPLHLSPDGKLPIETETVGLDGAIYHFAMAGYPGMTAKTWSPGANSAPGMLVAITDAMRDYCKSRDAKALAALDAAAAALEAHLKASPP